jgi:predicted dehydrogenase
MPYLVPSRVLGSDGRAGANDKVNVGIIGLGGRAGTIAHTCKPISDMRIVAVCDCFKPRCDRFVRAIGKDRNWVAYEDFRRMLDKEKLDGVMVETTTHARAWVTILAMQAGMDVYIEKPMCLTIAEGRSMVEAARKYNRVTQVGTQQRSMPINNWASDLVKNGAIGNVHTVLAPNFVGPVRWTDKPAEPMPQDGSADWWDIWTNQATFRPYHRRLHFGWEHWWAYDGGGRCFGVTGWGAHAYDQIQRALGTDETGPVEVWLEEPVENMPSGKSELPRDVDNTALEYLRTLAKPVVGPRAKVTMKYAGGTELKLHLDGDWGPGLGAIFVGDKGKIEINRNKIAGNPKKLIESPDNPGPIQKPETQYHIEDWIQCLKTRQRCTADIEFGQRSSTLCYLVNIARDVGRVGEKLLWDPATERFTNGDEANKMLSRPRRKAYELPALT